MTNRLLLVEDDVALGSALETTLRRARYGVTWCDTGAAAVAAVADDRDWDLIVLDLGLPDIDGVDLCRQLRTRLPEVVIVILTARDAEIDVVAGLESGADDYLVKPVRSTELIARLRAHLRRAAAPPASATVRQAGALRLDESARRAWLAERELALRHRHFELLLRLAVRPGAAVTRSQLMRDVWDENWYGSTKTLDVHVAGLRRALAEAGARTGVAPPSITTVRGFGYRLDVAHIGSGP